MFCSGVIQYVFEYERSGFEICAHSFESLCVCTFVNVNVTERMPLVSDCVVPMCLCLCTVVSK